MTARNAALYSLTGLRWWAAFAVFFFHMTAFAPLPIFPLFEYGNYGVMFFFVLSGFVLSWSWKAELPIRAFYLRRFGRIWPSAFVALVIAIPVFYSFAPDPSQWWVKPFDFGILLLSVPLIQGWWLAPAILFSGNPAAWTLTCEFFFYSLHPILQRGYVRIASRWVILAILVVFLGLVSIKSSCLLITGQPCTPLPLPIERLPEFVIGMGIGVLAKRGLLLPISPWIPLGVLGALYGYLAFGAFLHVPTDLLQISTQFANEITLLLMALTIAAVAQKDISGKNTVFRAPWLIRLGEVSFTFYLVHATVMYLFVDFFGQLDVSWKNAIWYPLVLTVGLLVAFALHIWVEKPFESKIRRFSDRISLSR